MQAAIMQAEAEVAEVAEVLEDGEPTLEELATVIRVGHTEVEAALTSAVERAIAVGEALLKARQRVPRGQWTAWQREQCALAVSVSARYMRLAEHADVVRNEGIATVKGATRYLVEAGFTSSRPRGRAPNPAIPGAVALVKDRGLSVSEAAALCDVNPSTLRKNLDPTYRAKLHARKRQQQQRALEAKAAERSRRATTAARKAGGAIAKLYADAERTQDDLARAQREATDARARHELSEAGMLHRQYRDKIVRALGVS
jgi:hypothetical protein